MLTMVHLLDYYFLLNLYGQFAHAPMSRFWLVKNRCTTDSHNATPCPTEPRTAPSEPFVKYPLEPVARLVDEAEGLKAQEFSSALL